MFRKKNKIAFRSPGTRIHMLSSNFVSMFTSIVSHKYSLIRNPTPLAPYFCYPDPSSFPLSMRIL